MGDLHGAHLALQQVLERSNFDPAKDTLISLGDICDGWPFVRECCEILQGLPNFVGIIGNHDDWAVTWARTNGEWKDPIWTTQGGEMTLTSFNNDPSQFPLEWFLGFNLIVEHDQNIFVHGGIDPNQKDINKQTRDMCTWDRELIHHAKIKHFSKPDFHYGGWDKIFVGHTTTQMAGKLEPLRYCNVIMMDTGAGWSGKLSLMDVDTGDYWQSDLVTDLYPNVRGRG